MLVLPPPVIPEMYEVRRRCPTGFGPQNGNVRTRLPRLWRAVEPTLWPDVALAVVLGAAAVWLTIAAADQDIPQPIRIWPPGADGPMVGFVQPDGGEVARDCWLNLTIAFALIARRRWPLVCFALQFTVLLGFDVSGNLAGLTAMLIGAYSLAVHGRSAVVSVGALVTAGIATAAVKTDTWPRLPGWAGVFALLLPVGLAGVAIRAARARARASDERAEALRREQAAATRLAVAGERARIARELHDVVSHHVSVMTIQAGAAGKVLDADPELARGALTAIETSGRETMAELRHLLGVLTPGPDDDLLQPQPGLNQLDALVDQVRRAGQPVSVRRTPTELPRGLDLTAYRVVQEALTNALRYAPGARTEIDISPAPPADLVIEVTNDAPPVGSAGPPSGDGSGTGPVGDGSGSGLVGLAERLRVYGGTLETGRRVGGGFRVRARLPLESAS
jgi:signal transduction histidine kinase